MIADAKLNLHRFDTAELLQKINSSLLTLDAYQATPQLIRD